MTRENPEFTVFGNNPYHDRRKAAADRRRAVWSDVLQPYLDPRQADESVWDVIRSDALSASEQTAITLGVFATLAKNQPNVLALSATAILLQQHLAGQGLPDQAGVWTQLSDAVTEVTVASATTELEGL